MAPGVKGSGPVLDLAHNLPGQAIPVPEEAEDAEGLDALMSPCKKRLGFRV